MKFAEVRECSKQKLLEEMQAENLDQARKQVETLERDLQTRRQEQDILKEETILVIQGKSALDRNMLADLVAENKIAVAKAHEALKMAKVELQELETSIEKSKQTCDDLFTWANVYEDADFNQRQAILHQFIKEVRVGRDYDVEIILNVSLDEFEEFKAHAWFPEDEKKGQMERKQAPKNVSSGSNASIVVMDEIGGQSLSIMPKTIAHASITYGG